MDECLAVAADIECVVARWESARYCAHGLIDEIGKSCFYFAAKATGAQQQQQWLSFIAMFFQVVGKRQTKKKPPSDVNRCSILGQLGDGVMKFYRCWSIGVSGGANALRIFWSRGTHSSPGEPEEILINCGGTLFLNAIELGYWKTISVRFFKIKICIFMG